MLSSGSVCRDVLVKRLLDVFLRGDKCQKSYKLLVQEDSEKYQISYSGFIYEFRTKESRLVWGFIENKWINGVVDEIIQQ